MTTSMTDNSQLLEFASKLQGQFIASTPLQHRRVRGQYFTPASVARFMAGLISSPSTRVRVLDAGAGTGMLSAAICDRFMRIRTPRRIELVLFESDPLALPLLEQNMKRCRSELHQAGHEMTYSLRCSDFVLCNQPSCDQELLFDNTKEPGDYDAAIMNPPYFKLNKESAHAQAFERIVHGQPNIYALFMATASTLLRAGGELVAITPRSFCSGPYFRAFRRWLFARMSLRHLHLFDSRTDTFREADVLQESLITLFTKGRNECASIRLSTSHGADFHAENGVSEYPSTQIIDDSDRSLIVRIPANLIDMQIMEIIEQWPARFRDMGLQISTGPVVTFRATDFLLETADHSAAVPLFYPHNVRPFETCWPIARNGKPLAFRACPESERLLLPTKNYVFLRRFSAKEEHRRLTASCFLPMQGHWPSRIAVENHVNYVYHRQRDLSDMEALGIAGYFNSAFLDRYFRCLSGNTQVNATEIRAMPFPSLLTLTELGCRIKRINLASREAVEHAVMEVLRITGAIARKMVECAA